MKQIIGVEIKSNQLIYKDKNFILADSSIILKREKLNCMADSSSPKQRSNISRISNSSTLHGNFHHHPGPSIHSHIIISTSFISTIRLFWRNVSLSPSNRLQFLALSSQRRPSAQYDRSKRFVYSMPIGIKIRYLQTMPYAASF